jgi:hypothetical protein
MTNPPTCSSGRRQRSANVSEFDDTSILNKLSTEGYPCSLSWLSRSQKGFAAWQPIAAAFWCTDLNRSSNVGIRHPYWAAS